MPRRNDNARGRGYGKRGKKKRKSKRLAGRPRASEEA
jgi:hypothetical protein